MIELIEYHFMVEQNGIRIFKEKRLIDFLPIETLSHTFYLPNTVKDYLKENNLLPVGYRKKETHYYLTDMYVYVKKD